jgi:hypothetical protein
LKLTVRASPFLLSEIDFVEADRQQAAGAGPLNEPNPRVEKAFPVQQEFWPN